MPPQIEPGKLAADVTVASTTAQGPVCLPSLIHSNDTRLDTENASAAAFRRHVSVPARQANTMRRDDECPPSGSLTTISCLHLCRNRLVGLWRRPYFGVVPITTSTRHMRGRLYIRRARCYLLHFIGHIASSDEHSKPCPASRFSNTLGTLSLSTVTADYDFEKRPRLLRQNIIKKAARSNTAIQPSMPFSTMLIEAHSSPAGH